MALDLAPARKEIRALSRVTGMHERDIRMALEAWASIEVSTPPAAEPRRGVFAQAGRSDPVNKQEPLRSETYRRWVASLPCAHCGIEGYSQCAHVDQGKGAGIKAGDDMTFPLCCDRPGVLGCHSKIGGSGLYSKENRRDLELLYATRTQVKASATGNWPKDWN